jgi:glycosyltransferase involved in cell wall biosynthesis
VVNIWLVRDLEPIPTDPGDRRLMRAGMLALALAARGHATTWFTSSFDHYQKRQRADRDATVRPVPNLTIEVFRGPGYRRNVSLARIAHNRSFAQRWRQYAEASTNKPDILVTDIPTTEAAEAVVKFAKENGIPTVLSIRDLWPDFFVDYLPVPLRPFARPFIAPLDRQARYAAANATSLIGISDNYLAWGLEKAGRSRAELDKVFPLGYRRLEHPGEDPLRAFRARFSLEKKSIVSFVGSWGKTYDLDLVLKVARDLRIRDDLVFVLAGDPTERPELRDAFLTLPNVVLTGWLSAVDISVLLSVTAVGLLPYHANAPQGLPNKVFEYLAYGTDQITTLKGELSAFLIENGVGRYSEPTSHALVRSITEAVREANDGDAWQRRIHLFEGRYSADAVYGGMVDHIEQVAALSRRRPGSAPRS